MSFDVDGFLDEMVRKGSLSADERNLAKPYFEKAEQELRDGYLRQSDYSRRMNELQEKMKAEDEFAQQLAQYEAQLKAKESATGNPGPSGGSSWTAPPAPTAAPPAAPDLKGYVKAEEAQRALMDTFKANVELLNITNEHQRLFGRSLERYDELVQKAFETGRSLRETWRDVHAVEKREREIQEEQFERRVQERLAEERAKWVTENSLDGGRTTPGVVSPFLQALKPEREVQSEQASRNERVQAAVQSFQAFLAQRQR